MAIQLTNDKILLDADGKVASGIDCCSCCAQEDLNYFNTIVINIHADGTGPVGCDMNWNIDFDPVIHTRADHNFDTGNNPVFPTFELFQSCGVISFGGSDSDGVYFDTPSGDTTLAIPTLTNTSGTPCTGGDNVLVQIASGSVQLSVSGQFLTAGVNLIAQCRLGASALCGISDTFGGNTPFPSLWINAPGSYTVTGTTTPSGWTINYSVTATVS